MRNYITVAGLILGGVYTIACNKPDTSQYVLDYDIVPSYSDTDTWAAYDAFNQYLFDDQTHIYKVDTDTEDGANTKATLGSVWTQAMYWDMAMNAYKKAVTDNDTDKQEKYKNLVSQIYQGDSVHYVQFDWHNQDSENGWFIYDDIMWWTISFSRAYGLFKDPKYLTLADESFCRVWHGSYSLKDRGSYDEENGGMFWNWNNSDPSDNSGTGKMACINFPTVVAAVILYNNIDPSDAQHKTDDQTGFNGDPDYPRWHSRDTYLQNAKEIYEWGVNNLFDKNTGNVADSRHGNSVDWSATIYNQGSFIGASSLLYKVTGEQSYLDNAVSAANYAMNTMSAPLYILPYGEGEEQGIYTAIFAQYMNMLIYDCGQTQFLKWVTRTIGYGWSHRDDRNLTGKDYTTVPASNVSCYDASGIPALMLLFPADK
ncbi:MAG: glycoside hydrolase family 76 protein [Niabella sp.]